MTLAYGPQQANWHVQLSLDAIQRWCSKWRIKLSAKKTKVILFTCCPTHKRHPIILQLFSSPLSISQEAAFLGVKYDSSLTFKSHFINLQNGSFAKMNSLHHLVGHQNQNCAKQMLQFYSAFIRSSYKYGYVATISASDVHLKKLQHIQSLLITSFLHLPSYISNEIAHDVSGLPMLNNHLRNFATKQVNSMKMSTPLILKLVQHHGSYANIPRHYSPLDVLS